MKWNLGLNFYSHELLLFNPLDLNDKKVTRQIKDGKFHLYVVCKRKKVFFESSEIEGDFCKSTFYYLDEKHDKVKLHYKHPSSHIIKGHKNGFYDVEIDGNPTKLRDFMMISNFSYLIDDVVGDSVKEPMPSDLEVMYIGQAYGRTTRKTIDYRVSHHEKVQKIALEILDSGSTEEVLIIGIKIKTNDIGTSIVSIDSNTEASTLDEIEALVKSAQKRTTEGQEITIYEASLIRYFQPRLNIEYKETFPSVDYPSYEEIYDTDFEYCAMTIDTKPVFVRLFSNHVPERKYVHNQHYPLRTKSDKESLFEYLYELNEKD